MNKRVVVTGMGAVTALGNSWRDVSRKLSRGESAIRNMPEWHDINGLNCRLGAPVIDFECSKSIGRKHRRGMGRSAEFAVTSAERALNQAGLLGSSALTDGSTGVATSSAGAPSVAFSASAGAGSIKRLRRR